MNTWKLRTENILQIHLAGTCKPHRAIQEVQNWTVPCETEAIFTKTSWET